MPAQEWQVKGAGLAAARETLQPLLLLFQPGAPGTRTATSVVLPERLSRTRTGKSVGCHHTWTTASQVIDDSVKGSRPGRHPDPRRGDRKRKELRGERNGAKLSYRRHDDFDLGLLDHA